MSYLKYKLLNCYPADEAALLHNAILNQRASGKWAKDDVGFFKEINRCLQASLNIFKANILDKGNGKTDFGYDELIKKENDESLSLVVVEDPIIRYLAFVAVHFNELTLSEFQFIMHALLDDEAKTEVVDNPLKKDTKVAQKLLVRWNDKADLLVRKLHLKENFSSKNDGKIIEFSREEFQVNFTEQYLSNWSWFCQQQFNYLYFEKRLLFSPDTPNKVFENFIRLAVEVAINDPDLYSKRVLLYTTINILNQKTSAKVIFNPYSEDLESEFTNVLQHLKEAGQAVELKKSDEFAKVGLLMAAMLMHEKLRTKISSFLNLLIAHSLYNTVLFFVKFLQKHKAFNPVHWLKELLHHGGPNVKKEAYDLLVKILAEADATDAFSMLQDIKTWFASKEELETDAEKAGACSMLDYLLYVLRGLDYNELGIFPLKFHLFNGIDDQENVKLKIEFVIEWVLNPELGKAYQVYGSFLRKEDFAFFNELVLAQFLIFISIVFTGLNNKAQSERQNKEIATALGDVLLNRLYDKAEKMQMRKIKHGLKIWRDYYAGNMYEVGKAAKTEKKDREILKALVQVSGSLLNFFNQKK